MEPNTTTVINKTERPNSTAFRAGGTGTPEFKIYFDDAKDLEAQLGAIASNEQIASHVASIKSKFGGQ